MQKQNSCLKAFFLNPQKVPESQNLDFIQCSCEVCSKNNTQNKNDNKMQKQQHALQIFLKDYPLNVPLQIFPTTFYKPDTNQHLHYSNSNKIDNKNYICKTKVNKIMNNYPLANNIHIYGSNFSKIISKDQTSKYIKRLEEKSLLKYNLKQIQTIQSLKINDKLLKYNHHQNPPFIQKKNTLNNLINHNKLNNINIKNDKVSIKNKKQKILNNKNNKNNYKKLSEHKNNQSSSIEDDSNSNKYCQALLNSKILYIQSYYPHEIPLKIYYKKSQINQKLDTIILEHIQAEQQLFLTKIPYQINEQFWQWIYKQYGQQIFILFATEFYCRVYHKSSKNIINQAIFYWVFENIKSQFDEDTKITQQLGKNKSAFQIQYFIAKTKKLNFKIKLLNIMNMKIQFHKNIKTFQQQYQQLILKKIKTSPSQIQKQKALSLFNQMNRKKYIYSNRLDNFQLKVRDIFLKQQNNVLSQVQQQKQHQGPNDSNYLAKLLMPNMGQYKTIRQILNNQHAFQKIVLYHKKIKQRQRIKRAKQMLLGQTLIDHSETKFCQLNDNRNRNGHSNSRVRKSEQINYNKRNIKSRIKTQFY